MPEYKGKGCEGKVKNIGCDFEPTATYRSALAPIVAMIPGEGDVDFNRERFQLRVRRPARLPCRCGMRAGDERFHDLFVDPFSSEIFRLPSR